MRRLLSELPFEVFGFVCRAARRYEERHSVVPASPEELRTIKTIASGLWMDGVKDIGSGT
jgi:hypothetical protein